MFNAFQWVIFLCSKVMTGNIGEHLKRYYRIVSICQEPFIHIINKYINKYGADCPP